MPINEEELKEDLNSKAYSGDELTVDKTTYEKGLFYLSYLAKYLNEKPKIQLEDSYIKFSFGPSGKSSLEVSGNYAALNHYLGSAFTGTKK